MSWFRRLLTWHASGHRTGAARIARYARLYYRHYENFNHLISENGELALLRRLAPFRPSVIFDVGANKGDWSAAAAGAIPGAEIHAFEIDASTASVAAARLAGRAKVHAFGLSDRDGEAALTLYGGSTEASSLMSSLGDRTSTGTASVTVRSGAGFCAEHGIERIDVLKIDTEGAERLVLEGFAEMIANGQVEIVQFEYGMTNIYTRVLLKDFYEMLPGYAIGKVMPRGVRFADYHPRAEDFIGLNYLAVSRSRRDIIEAVALRK